MPTKAAPMGLFALPYSVVMIVLVAGAVVAGCGAHAVVRRFVASSELVEHNDVAGFMIAVVGVIYAVLLAFVVVVVWQQYNGSDADYGSEVSAVADVHAYARSLAPLEARKVQSLAHRYVDEMIAEEWPAMRDGGHSVPATATLAELERAGTLIAPATPVQAEARIRVLESTQRVFDLRNRRLSDNQETLPPVLWAALVVGAVITVGFGYLFGVKNVRVQLIMTGAIAALIGVMFTLLVELDFPFRRDMAISTARWVELQRYLDIAGDVATHSGGSRNAEAFETPSYSVPGESSSF